MFVRRALAVLLAALCVVFVSAVPSSAAVTTTTAWRDNFNSLNGSVWRVVGTGCDAAAHVSVSGGLLHLQTVASSSTQCPLVGARIDTFGKRQFAPGTLSARIKFMPRTGSWDTFWATGASGRTFPANGEIDIAEILGRDTPPIHHLRLHAAWTPGVSGRCTQQLDIPRPPGFMEQWHVYSVTTTTTTATFRVDGQVVALFTQNMICTWPFADPMRPIFAVGGGTYGGTPDKSLFPTTTLVDWFSYTPGS